MDIRSTLFRSWFRLTRSMTLGVRAIVENEARKILLVRHTYVDGLYLPGGGVEHNEPAIDSLERELVEEAGVKMSGVPDLLGIFSNHRIFRNDHVLLYRVTDWVQVEATSQGEIAERLWCDPSDLPEDATPGTVRRVRAAYQRAGIDKYW